MRITLEQVENLRKKVNCDYQLAEKALRKSKGNIDDAILYLKKRENRKLHKVFIEIEQLFHKVLAYNLIVFKNNKNIIHFPVVLLIGIVLFFNFSIELLIIIGILAAFSNLQFEIIDKQMGEQTNNYDNIKMTPKKPKEEKSHEGNNTDTKSSNAFKSEEINEEKLKEKLKTIKQKPDTVNKTMDNHDDSNDNEFNEIIIE